MHYRPTLPHRSTSTPADVEIPTEEALDRLEARLVEMRSALHDVEKIDVLRGTETMDCFRARALAALAAGESAISSGRELRRQWDLLVVQDDDPLADYLLVDPRGPGAWEQRQRWLDQEWAGR